MDGPAEANALNPLALDGWAEANALNALVAAGFVPNVLALVALLKADCPKLVWPKADAVELG